MAKPILAESMTIRVTPKEKARISEFAQRHGITFSAAIRVLCAQALDNDKENST